MHQLLLHRHEPLYEQVVRNVIRSDEFRIGDPGETQLMLGGSRVILCTLSMLSNPALLDCGVFNIIPLERLVIDEASQIEVFQYMVRKKYLILCIGGITLMHVLAFVPQV